ncbi:MAG: hypothetical protein ACYSRP_08115 [Planctomycetota bacterium]|jgi:hypothetical protein
MSNEDQVGITSFDLGTESTTSSYQINQHLQKGTYRLIIVAPFDTKILVTPLNPPLGFEFHPDMDSATEIWNSLLVTPQDGQYAFLVKVDRPIDNESLHVQFVFQSPAPDPPPPAPPAPPPGDMQEYYRGQGYRIAGDGAVEFYYIAFRTNKSTRQREICMQGLFSWSKDLHDPARTIQKLTQEDAGYRYNRLGPFPNRAQAEASAIQFATRIFGDPTRYGIWGTGGLRDIQSSDYRNPSFR